MEISGSCNCVREEGGIALGRQMTVEFYDCSPGVLADAGAMEKIFLDSARQSGATVIDSQFHQFSPQGVSGVVVISESHFAVHAWPEYGYAAVDLFTCGEGVDFDKAIEVIASGIGCRDRSISSLVNRGILGRCGVEKTIALTENNDVPVCHLSWEKRYRDTGGKAISCSIDVSSCKSELKEASQIKRFIADFIKGAGFECRGEIQLNNSDRWSDFSMELTEGRISGSIDHNDNSLYLDLFAKRFFDPREVAEKAVRMLDGGYYRMQVQIRN